MQNYICDVQGVDLHVERLVQTHLESAGVDQSTEVSAFAQLYARLRLQHNVHLGSGVQMAGAEVADKFLKSDG